MNWKYIIIRWIITAAAVFLTTYLVPGFRIEEGGFIAVFAIAFVLGLVNAIIRPILIILSCGCIVITLGLFLFVVNAITLLIASSVSQFFGLGFYVDGFWPALFGSVVISVISWLLSMFLIGDKERSH